MANTITLNSLIMALQNDSKRTDSSSAKVIMRSINLLGNNGNDGLDEVCKELPALLKLRDSSQATRIFDALEILTSTWEGNTYIPATNLISVDRETGTVSLNCEPLVLAKLVKDRGFKAELLWPVFYGMKKAKAERPKAQTYTNAELAKELARIYKRASQTDRAWLAKQILEHGGTVPTKGLV